MNHPRTLAEHLYVVISHAADENEQVLMVNLTTYRDGLNQETCCCLSAGDHPFVQHDTVINYEDALCPKVSFILEAVRNGVIKEHDDVYLDLLQRIQNGAKISEAIQNKMKKFFDKF